MTTPVDGERLHAQLDRIIELLQNQADASVASYRGPSEGLDGDALRRALDAHAEQAAKIISRAAKYA